MVCVGRLVQGLKFHLNEQVLHNGVLIKNELFTVN